MSTTTQERSTIHYQTIHSYRFNSNQHTDSKGTDIAACIHRQLCTDELIHVHVHTSVYTAYRFYVQICKHLYMSVIKEQNERNIGKVCVSVYTVWTYRNIGEMCISICTVWTDMMQVLLQTTKNNSFL